jgi:hypothetical protein
MRSLIRKVIRSKLLPTNKLLELLFKYLLKRNNNLYPKTFSLRIKEIPNIFSYKNLLLNGKITIEENVTILNERLLILNDGAVLEKNQTYKSDYSTVNPLIIGETNKETDFKTSDPIFILGTGRSGTNSIIDIFNLNRKINSYHEPCDELIALSYYKEYGLLDTSEIESRIAFLFNSIFKKDKINIISDNKLGNLVPELISIYPNAKFIWLIRNPYEFISSAYYRGWFANEEFGFKMDTNEPKVYSSKIFSKFRINGSKSGEFTELEWRKMGAFKRNCWYWSYWNIKIETHLSRLEKNRWFLIDLADLESKLDEIAWFIGTPNFKYKFAISNKAKYKKKEKGNWSADQLDTSKVFCAAYYDHINNIKS